MLYCARFSFSMSFWDMDLKNLNIIIVANTMSTETMKRLKAFAAGAENPKRKSLYKSVNVSANPTPSPAMLKYVEYPI